MICKLRLQFENSSKWRLKKASSELRMCDFTEWEQLTVDQIYLLLVCFDKNEMSKYFCYWRRRNLIKYNGGGKRVN